MQAFKTKTRKIRFWINLFKAYLSRYKYRLIFTVVSIFILVLATGKVWNFVSRSNVVTIGYEGNFTLETVPASVLSLATQPLIGTDSTGRSVPSLASHWTTSEDGKTFLVFLKDNLRWHDDTQVDAKDITIPIQNVEVSALNNKTIQFQLSGPIASFPQALNKPVFKSKTFYGTGMFRIVDISSTNDIVQKISLAPKDKTLPRVEIKFYPTEKQLISAIKIGDVKYAKVANANIFENWPNLDVEKEIENNQVETIFFNTADPDLSSQDLRQALTYSINRSNFDGQVATGPISPQNWAYTTDVKKYEYNTAKAKELLKKSQITKPKITLTFEPGHDEIANQIKKSWEEIGVEVILKSERNIPQEFQALLATNILPPDPDQYALWHSTQTETNLTKLKNVKIDKILEDGRVTQKEEERKDLYQDFQRFLTEDDPAAFLYYPYKYKVVYKNQKTLIEKLNLQ